jgi:hypothetical protein
MITEGSLHRLFLDFAASLRTAELIDGLQMTAAQKRAKKADIFFDGRAIICEMKSLRDDVSNKVERILEPHRERTDFPNFYNTWPVDAILEHLPDGDELHREMFNAISSGIADGVAEANRQIRETKRAFGLPEASGILVVLNESVSILDPRVIAHRAFQSLSKKTPEGSARYPDVGGVWVISRAHRVKINSNLEAVPAIILTNPLTGDHKAAAFLARIQKDWAKFIGLPLTELPETAYSTVEYEPLEAEEETITLSELWRREYRAAPYLASLSDDEVIFYFARLSVEMSIIQGNLLAGRYSHLRCTRRFAESLEELNRRHIDMRIVREHAEREGMQPPTHPDIWEDTAILANDCDILVDV